MTTSMNKRDVSRDVAALLGGVALGIMGSRLLPPLFASANGTVRGRLGADPFDQLIQDHRRILSILDQMIWEDATTRRGKLFLQLKRTLAKHAMAEEDVVYPLLIEGRLSDDDVKHLYEEHADIKISLFRLERMLKNKEDWTSTVRDLRELVQKHAREEEEIEFPKLRMASDRRHKGTIAGQIRREEALVL
jgi:iron-sulfur cluster repair protein YtfE (RIC family)